MTEKQRMKKEYLEREINTLSSLLIVETMYGKDKSVSRFGFSKKELNKIRKKLLKTIEKY